VSGLAALLPVEACGTLLRRAAEPGALVVAAGGLDRVAVVVPRKDGWEVIWTGDRLIVRAAIVHRLIAPRHQSPRLGTWAITVAGRIVLAEIVEARDRQGHLLRELRELREEVEVLRARAAEVETVGPAAPVHLTHGEAEVLGRLRAGGARGATRASLHDALVGASGHRSDIKIVDVYISRLRTKGWQIRTIWGRGYALLAEPAEAAPEPSETAPETAPETPAGNPVSDPSETPLQPA
jgi:hypothetical protein